jgi:Kef-type K+ transport system membrane component KefB
MPVYVVFFAISGASLNLEALRVSWLLALVFVVWRGVLKFFGTYIGARLVKEEPGIQKHSWTGFISQAGVSLGMAIVVAENFPEWGEQFKALALGVIAINQIIGPILFHRLLIKKGEASVKPS